MGTFMILILHVRTEVHKLQALGRIWQLSVLVSSMLWEHSHLVHLYAVYG